MTSHRWLPIISLRGKSRLGLDATAVPTTPGSEPVPSSRASLSHSSFLHLDLSFSTMADTYSLTSRIPLNDGNSYPRFGLGAHAGWSCPAATADRCASVGVYVTEPGEETYNAVTWALEVRLLPPTSSARRRGLFWAKGGLRPSVANDRLERMLTPVDDGAHGTRACRRDIE